MVDVVAGGGVVRVVRDGVLKVRVGKVVSQGWLKFRG